MESSVPVAPEVIQKIKTGLPIGNTPEDAEKRNELWKKLDVNGNGQLSLIELGKGLRESAGLPELAEAKVALSIAFDAARKKAGGTKADNATVTPDEFQALLFFLNQYFEYWVAFNRIDSNPNHQISLAEFTAAIPKFSGWGIKVENAEDAFKQVDSNHSGSITFGEFVRWASLNTLHLAP